MPMQELFHCMGRACDAEVELIVAGLAKKAGEVSNAGRDTFLAAEADKTLAMIVEYGSEAKVAAAFIGCASHKSPTVRTKIAAQLDLLLQGDRGARLAGEPFQPMMLVQS